MSATWSDFLPYDCQEPVNVGHAVARIMRERWPRDTAKHGAKHWNLDLTTATNATKGSASERTITKAIKADGWAFISALGEAMTGHSYEDYLEGLVDEQRKRAEAQQAQHQRVADLRRRAMEFGTGAR